MELARAALTDGQLNFSRLSEQVCRRTSRGTVHFSPSGVLSPMRRIYGYCSTPRARPCDNTAHALNLGITVSNMSLFVPVD
jgi:hypothetical protein